MEKYLRMSDVFKSELFIDSDCDDVIVDDLSLTVLESFSGSDAAKFAIHAINSHDELVAMNKELLAALDGVLAIVGDSGGVAGYHLNGDIADWGEFDEINAVYAAIEKAKAAS